MDARNRGTPKTLDQAIEHAIDDLASEPSFAEAKEQVYRVLRDFIAQKANVALLRAAQAADDKDYLSSEKIVTDFFKDITKRAA